MSLLHWAFLTIREVIKGVGEVILAIKCLSCQQEDLSSDPQYSCEKSGMVACICKYGTGVEAGGFQKVASQSASLNG